MIFVSSGSNESEKPDSGICYWLLFRLPSIAGADTQKIFARVERLSAILKNWIVVNVSGCFKIAIDNSYRVRLFIRFLGSSRCYPIRKPKYHTESA